MNDFEVHPLGTTTEIRLSRALANELSIILKRKEEMLPYNVVVAYNKLIEEYQRQMHMETV